MKPLFVSLENHHRDIHWTKLVISSIAMFLVVAGSIEGLWYLIAGQLSWRALVVALVACVLITARTVVRVLTYQEEELEMSAASE